ncbi:unnamed protein product [Brassica oleracea var. botrytis]
MDVQVDYLTITRKQFDKLLGEEKARDHIKNKSIFSLVIGSNNFLIDYLVPFVAAQARLTQTPEIFVEDMLVISVANSRSTNQLKDKQCVDLTNKLTLQYNARLKDLLLVELKDSLKDVHFVYASVYHGPHCQLQRIWTAREACCGTEGRLAGILPCGPTSCLCKDRSKLVVLGPVPA